MLEAAGHRDDFTLINARAVAAAREARDMSGREVAIAGSISCLPPRFDVHAYPDESTERSAYLELAETLAEAGVDLLVLEMLQETRHAPLACAAARAVGLAGMARRQLSSSAPARRSSGSTSRSCRSASVSRRCCRSRRQP